ncbi:MAG: HNH endonuclease [Gammaproteobacteria bacterium]|nr:HNH endonuclease [Gammaproteobacteria bacterium]
MSIDDKKDVVWEKAKTVRGKDPATVRRDTYGNEMLYNSYGKNSPKGWEIDHIKPKSRGGSDATVNLQALNTKTNREKGDSLKKRSRHSQR